MDSKNDVMSSIVCVLSSLLKKWYIVLFVTVAMGCGYDVFRTVMFEPIYSSRVVSAIVNTDSGVASSSEAENCVKSLDYILKSNVAKKYVNEKMGMDSFNGQIQTSLMPSTNFYTITVNAPTQKEAYQSLRYLLEWYAKTSESSNFGYSLNIVEEHYLNYVQNFNSHRQNLKIAGMVGFILSSAVICVFAYLSDNIKSSREIDQKIDARLFARIPREIKRGRGWHIFKKNRKAILISNFKTSFEYVEAVKKLSTKVQASSKKHNYQTILVTSSMENEGKSSVAVNLALALGASGKKVLMMDCDLRQPALHKILETKPKITILHVLNGTVSWREAVVGMDKYHVDVLFSKNAREKSGEFLESEVFGRMLSEMKQEYDYIIMDSAPARYLTDTLVVANHADATLVVVKQNGASATLINDTIYRLVRSSGNVIGCVYNGSIIEPRQTKSGYHYRYGNYSYRNQRG